MQPAVPSSEPVTIFQLAAGRGSANGGQDRGASCQDPLRVMWQGFLAMGLLMMVITLGWQVTYSLDKR